jgi:hypothetical protein
MKATMLLLAILLGSAYPTSSEGYLFRYPEGTEGVIFTKTGDAFRAEIVGGSRYFEGVSLIISRQVDSCSTYTARISTTWRSARRL